MVTSFWPVVLNLLPKLDEERIDTFIHSRPQIAPISQNSVRLQHAINFLPIGVEIEPVDRLGNGHEINAIRGDSRFFRSSIPKFNILSLFSVRKQRITDVSGDDTIKMFRKITGSLTRSGRTVPRAFSLVAQGYQICVKLPWVSNSSLLIG